MLRGRFFFPLLLAVAALAAACGGGGGGTPPVAPSPAASTTPHAGPTQVPVGPSPQAVDISGDGYTLSFDLPPVTGGSPTTLNAVLQTALPTGTVAPQVARRGYAPPRAVPSTFSALVYLVITAGSQSVGFSEAPNFQFSIPSSVTIPSTSNAYMLYWDPYVSGSSGWITLLGPGTVNGHIVTFPGVQTGMQFNSNAQYDFALAITTQKPPTATPAPTPTPTVNPSATPSSLPAYCANYSTPAPNANSSPQPVYFTDNSGTGAKVVFYVVSGAIPGTNETQYLAANGQFVTFTNGATAAPFPLECFPGSTHQGNGKTFELPPPAYNNQSGNLYIALGTPDPNGNAPNPLTFVGTVIVTPSPSPGASVAPAQYGYSGPSDDWHSTSYSSVPFDEVEYTLPYGVTDVTQVNHVGLPLELVQGSSKFGFDVGGYDTLLSEISSDPVYKSLAVGTVLNGRNVLARILSPEDGLDWGFPQDYFYNSTYSGSNSADNLGYLGYVLQQYQTAPALYTTAGIGKAGTGEGSGDNYCVSFDGVSNVLMYDVGTASSCSSKPAGSPTFTMPIDNTLQGTVPSNGVCEGLIFTTPYGPGSPFSTNNQNDEFYVWKAMVTDLIRGVALQPGTHPIGSWSITAGTATFGQFYLDPFYSKYARYVHANMINNASYAFAYDEPGGLAPTFTSDPSKPLQITLQNIPAFARAVPTATPTPLPCPP